MSDADIVRLQGIIEDYVKDCRRYLRRIEELEQDNAWLREENRSMRKFIDVVTGAEEVKG